MAGRLPKLSHNDLRRIDSWMVRRPGSNRQRQVPTKVICHRLDITSSTLYDAFNRRGAYAGCAR